MEQVRAVGGFVDGDSKSVVVVAVWLLLFLGLGPWKRNISDTGEETLALVVVAVPALGLYPTTLTQIDLVHNDIFKVTGDLVAERKDEFAVVPGDGH